MVSYLALPPLKGFAVVAPEEIIHVAPELKVCPLALADPVFWGLWGSSNKQMGDEQGSTVVGKGDGVEMQHPASILGKVSGLWEEYWQHFSICFGLL